MNISQLYQVMPPLSAEENAALKADIAARGVQVPVEYDDEGNILDGFHRVQICQELGIDCPKVVRRGLTDAEKRAHAWALNLTRRHLSKAQKRTIAKTLRGEGWTMERIAQALGLSQATISNRLAEFINSDELHDAEPIMGKDGKRYPKRKARPEARQPTGKAEAEREVDPDQPAPIAIPIPHSVEATEELRSAETRTDADPSIPERSGGLLPDDPSRRVRALIDALYEVLIEAQHPGGVKALTEHWSATMRRHYHARCSSLNKGLKELQAVLAAPTDDNVTTATSQANNDVGAGTPEGDATGGSANNRLGSVADENASSAYGSPDTATVVGPREVMGGTRWEEEL
jgi:transcriptional regulator with XRE-family HTH domain